MTDPRSIVISRLINAPRAKVWKAWIDPEALAQWWGPNGFSITTESFTFTEGGTWIFMMHGPDGRDYPNKVVFTEITEPERISHIHGDGKEIQFQATVTFEAQGEKTLVTMQSTFATAEELQRVVKEHNAIEGGKQTLGRLAGFVE